MEIKYPKGRRFALNFLMPFTKWIGGISFSMSHAIDDAMAFEMSHLINPGDVLLTYAKGHATNILIPGEFKHAAMYVGEIGCQPSVIEALGKGVRFTSFDTFAMAKDKILIVKPMFCDDLMAEQAVVYAKTLVGESYDYLVEYSIDMRVNKAFYCSEIPWWSYNRAMIAAGKTSPFVPRETFGVETITPQDYALAIDKWAVIGRWPNLG